MKDPYICSVSWPSIHTPAFVQTIGTSACNDIWKGLGNGSANYPHCRAFSAYTVRRVLVN